MELIFQFSSSGCEFEDPTHSSIRLIVIDLQRLQVAYGWRRERLNLRQTLHSNISDVAIWINFNSWQTERRLTVKLRQIIVNIYLRTGDGEKAY